MIDCKWRCIKEHGKEADYRIRIGDMEFDVCLDCYYEILSDEKEPIRLIERY